MQPSILNLKNKKELDMAIDILELKLNRKDFTLREIERIESINGYTPEFTDDEKEHIHDYMFKMLLPTYKWEKKG